MTIGESRLDGDPDPLTALSSFLAGVLEQHAGGTPIEEQASYQTPDGHALAFYHDAPFSMVARGVNGRGEPEGPTALFNKVNPLQLAEINIHAREEGGVVLVLSTAETDGHRYAFDVTADQLRYYVFSLQPQSVSV